jgi:tetratricopeptide (TPR) repeat protein
MLTTKARSTSRNCNLSAILAVAVVLLISNTAAKAQEAENACGPVGIGSVSEGPYDYRVDRKRVEFIESNHFQPQVQALIRGVSGPIGAELDFLLRHVPNHHKALLLLITYGEKLKWTQPNGLRYPYECWYERAIRWQPNDAVVRMIYAIYLNKRSRANDALSLLKSAADLAGDNGFTQYNVGLIYLEMKQYDLALAQAHKALSLGFNRPALRDGLQAAGKWTEPASVAEPAPQRTPK